jgi:hypothetical protein
VEQIQIRLNHWADRYFKQQRELLIGLSVVWKVRPEFRFNRGDALIEDENGKIIVPPHVSIRRKSDYSMKDGERMRDFVRTG